MEIDLFDFYNHVKKKEVLTSFKGNLSSEILTSSLQLIENKLEDLEVSTRLKKRVYNVLVEALQNLFHHIVENPKMNQEKTLSTVVFEVAAIENGFLISTGNCIENSNVEMLKSRIEQINSMDADQLKEHYKEVLNNGMMSDKGGGGLGMIDIARKSAHDLEYNFKKIDNNYSLYTLFVKIVE